MSLFDLSPFIMAAGPWRDNGQLIADCAQLGYLKTEWVTLDATYGLGNWWTDWAPDKLVTNDLDPDKDSDFHQDFRGLEWPDEYFDAVAYDPPYIAPGGRERQGDSGRDLNRRFGLLLTPRTAPELQEYINDGLREMARLAKPRGFILVKCKNYVSGNGFWPGAFLTWQCGVGLGLQLVDCLQHTGSQGPLSVTTQVHSRQNYSTLLVFRKPRLRPVQPR